MNKTVKNILELIGFFLVSLIAIEICGKINLFAHSHISNNAVSLVVAPTTEEAIKYLSALFFAMITKSNLKSSGYKVGFFFGAIETFFYYYFGVVSGMLVLFRILLALPLHTVIGGISTHKKNLLPVAIALHATYNFAYICGFSIPAILLCTWSVMLVALAIMHFSSYELAKSSILYLRNNIVGLSLTTTTIIGLVYCLSLYWGAYLGCMETLRISQYCL